MDSAQRQCFVCPLTISTTLAADIGLYKFWDANDLSIDYDVMARTTYSTNVTGYDS
ncbi:hypothetical protein HMPREF0454_03835 [Hafnia alvei ATCC 51873]|uniref:Uncharacterized protein n=1 Tax=Hafnia alvei ATCC 51873 TaxID=1002364 RepID=G9YB56_HAFAL|nr:hypothetical protein HMPREF0454_03835 [Hafnia alvei ATCC 51873]